MDAVISRSTSLIGLRRQNISPPLALVPVKMLVETVPGVARQRDTRNAQELAAAHI